MNAKEQEARKDYFRAAFSAFNKLAETNNLKGKTKQKCAFYFMQGMATKDEILDPVLYIALIRSDISELVEWIDKEKNNQEKLNLYKNG